MMSDDGRRCPGDIGQLDTKLFLEICPLPLGGLGHGSHLRTSHAGGHRRLHLWTGQGFDLELSWW